MRVAFLTRDFSTDPVTGVPIPNGCAYYRCALPMSVLGPHEAKMGLPAWLPERGFGIVTGPAQAEFGFPVVVLKLLMGREIPHQILGAQAIGQKVIIDVDDHYDALDDANIAKHATDPTRSRTWNRDNYRDSILLADMITVTTPTLAEHYDQWHDNVLLIRNGIHPDMFQQRRQQSKPVIGWAGAIPWRSNDLDQLRWLPEFLHDHDLMFHHSGVLDEDDTVATRLGIPPERFTFTPMLPLNLYPQNLLHFDIGLVPLAPIPFNEAKSTIKGLEYAAAGIPFVASATSEYERLAQHGIGRVARKRTQWIAHLVTLLDRQVRRQEAAIQRERLATHTILARAQQWRSAVESLV